MYSGDREPVIVGVGQTEYHKRPNLPTLWYVIQAAKLALDNAGLHPSDVDGLGVSSFLLSPDNTSTVAEQLGVQLNWGFSGAYGGASPLMGVMEAAEAIYRGQAETVVLVAADAYSLEGHVGLINDFNTGMRDYIVPYGNGGTNGLFAMLERRHAHEFGTTKEQLGKLAVTQRYNASLNPNALLRDPMSLGDYLESPMICDPIRLFDCVLPCGGGEGAVLTTRARAEEQGKPFVRILSGGSRINYKPTKPFALESGWAEFAPKMFEDAGLQPKDIDMLQYYDDYPIMGIIQMEGLGFCEPGMGGKYVESTDISINGDMAVNTGGGQLSCGQSGEGGGQIALTEALIQLFGTAGARQRKKAETAVVSGFGMIGYVKGLGQSAVILKREA